MALALDGSAHGSSTAIALGVTLTTVNSGDVIEVALTGNGGPFLSVAGTGLTFTLRSRQGAGASVIEKWSAVATLPLSSVVITATQSNIAFITVDAYGISGADTTTIYDSNGSLPNKGTTDPRTVSTTNANTFITGAFRLSTLSPTAGSGFTIISGADFQLTEYQIVAAAQTNLSVPVGTGVGTANGAIADAIFQLAAGLAANPLHGGGAAALPLRGYFS